MLVERSPGRGLKNKIMEIVYHLNLGAELIASRKERLRLAEYNLLAGRVAKSSAAYESARRYLLAAWRCSRNTLPASTVRSGRSFSRRLLPASICAAIIPGLRKSWIPLFCEPGPPWKKRTFTC